MLGLRCAITLGCVILLGFGYAIDRDPTVSGPMLHFDGSTGNMTQLAKRFEEVLQHAPHGGRAGAAPAPLLPHPGVLSSPSSGSFTLVVTNAAAAVRVFSVGPETLNPRC